MNFREAFDAMRHGKKVKLPWWDGYWAYEHGDIIMYCRDGVARSIMESELPEYTYMNMASDEFEIADEPQLDNEKENSSDSLFDNTKFKFNFNKFTSFINNNNCFEILLSVLDLLSVTHENSKQLSFSVAMIKLLENVTISRESWNRDSSLYEGVLDRYVFIDTLENGTKIIKETKREGRNEKTMNYYPSTEDITSNDWFIAYTNYKVDTAVPPESDLYTKDDTSISTSCTFNIHTAIDYLSKGKPVTREKWLKQNKEKYIHGITHLNNDLVFFLFQKQYSFDADDILSTDWMLYEVI